MRMIVALGFGVMLLSGTAALADTPGADWMPVEQVKAKLLSAGYSSITKIEADDGHWEGEGVKAGKKMEFHADPRTGAITSEKPDD
jgi:hypothetical protein